MSFRPGWVASRSVAFLLGLALTGAGHASAVLQPSGAAYGQEAAPEQVNVSTPRLQRVAELVNRNIQSGAVSGAVTLVARDGHIVWLQAQGVSDVASRTPMQKDTIFRVASMTKPVTAVAILILVEEGKIHLTDPVSRFLPQFKDCEAPLLRRVLQDPFEREITILDLLTHTSGIMSGPMSNDEGKALIDARQAIGLKWTESLPSVPLEFPPGTRWSYSGIAGFDLLAHIVEVVSGQNFNEFVTARIFQPLAMRETFFWPNAEQRLRLVHNYTNEAHKLVPRQNPDDMSSATYFSGAGGLMSTAESYARFAMMLANGGELDGVRILSPRSVELMGSPFAPDTLPGRDPGEGFGLGVRVVTDPVKLVTTLSKGSFGWTGAYGTHFFVDPSKHLVGILMVQTPVKQMRPDFEDAVMQAVLD
jgi:CubicO group peptidase (beta-lactamase class C family)